MGSSQESSASNAGSLMFERALGSLGASISPEDYFITEESHDDDTVEGSFSPEGESREESLGE